MRRLRAGDEETILVCPICDSAMIRRRFPDKQQSRNLPADADRWYCRVGQHAFAQPTERPPRASQSTSGLAKRLEDADPDDVGLRTDGGLVEACPECESSNINQRQFPRTPDEEWFCLDCREAFGEPIHRPPKQPGGNYSAIGKRLIEADPDDLRTDGGVRRRHPGDGAETLAGVGDQDPGCPHGDVACARGDVPCWDCLVGGDET